MTSFINATCISIIIDKLNFRRLSYSDLKCIAFTISTMILYISFFVSSLIIFSLFIANFKPQIPTVDLDSVNITNLNTKAVNLTATFDLSFIFETPGNHKRNVCFSDLKVRVLWFGKDKITLAKKILLPFSQVENNVTKIRAELTVIEGFTNSSDVSTGIGAERDSGSLHIGVSLTGSFMLRDGFSEALRHDFDRIVVKFPPGSNNGTYVLVPRPIFPNLWSNVM